MEGTSINLDSHDETCLRSVGGATTKRGPGRRRLTEAQIMQIAELREAGLTTRSIALRFHVSTALVEWHCLRLGADAPRGGYAPRNVPECPKAYRRGGRWVRLFTQAEDARLLDMARNARPLPEIAAELQRSANSIVGRLMVLARREARAEL